VLADPAMPDLLHRRLREEPLPAPHAPTASGWSNSSRVGFFLLLDQDALSRRTAPSIYSVCFLRSAARSEEGGCHFSAGKVLFHL